MNTLEKIAGGVLLVLALLVGGSYFNRPSVTVNVPEPKAQYGSVTGPDSYFPVEKHNGVGYGFYAQSFQTASTSICSQRVFATSTIDFVQFQNFLGTSTALTYRVSTSTGPTATTTSLFTQAQPTGRIDSYVYRGKAGDIVGPGTFINVSIEGIAAVSLGSGLTGTCQISTNVF